MEKKKPKGWAEFDALAKRLVTVPKDKVAKASAKAKRARRKKK